MMTCNDTIRCGGMAMQKKRTVEGEQILPLLQYIVSYSCMTPRHSLDISSSTPIYAQVCKLEPSSLVRPVNHDSLSSLLSIFSFVGLALSCFRWLQPALHLLCSHLVHHHHHHQGKAQNILTLLSPFIPPVNITCLTPPFLYSLPRFL